MTAKLINDLPTVDTLSSTDQFIVRDPEGTDVKTKKTTLDALAQYVGANVTGITIEQVSGLQGALDAKQNLDADLTAAAALSTTGIVRRDGDGSWSAGTQVATAEVADDAITYAKLQNVSATDKLLARVSSGAGNVEEVDFTDFAQSMSAAAAASDARTLLGLTSPATTTPAALTKTDDTNVTLTLGGTPNTALLQATSITVGWTGTLGAARLNGNVVQGVTNDTNVTGSISTQNLTLGWTGTLAVARGGTGASTESGARTALGLAIGSDVQAYSARLTTVAGYTPTKGKLLVGDGTNWNELPVGANDYVLTADSIQSLGMLWKAAPGSGGGLSDAYDQFTDGTNVADATGGDTFKFRAGTGVTVTVQSNDGTHGDNLLIALNAVLTAFAGVTVAADKLIYGNGTNTFGTSDLTAAGRALLDDADAAAQRATLGLGSASASEFWAGTDAVKPVTADTVADAAARVGLTSGTTINTDCSAGRNFKVTLGHNATFAKPTNMQDGVVYTWQINQPSSGGPYTGAFNAAFEFPSTPALSTAASTKDLVSAMYDADADVLVAGFRKGS